MRPDLFVFGPNCRLRSDWSGWGLCRLTSRIGRDTHREHRIGGLTPVEFEAKPAEPHNRILAEELLYTRTWTSEDERGRLWMESALQLPPAHSATIFPARRDVSPLVIDNLRRESVDLLLFRLTVRASPVPNALVVHSDDSVQ